MDEPETITPEYEEIKEEQEIKIDDNKIKIEMNNNEIIYSLIIDLSFNKYIKRFKHDEIRKLLNMPEEIDLKLMFNILINIPYEINEKEKKLIFGNENEIK